MSDKSEALEALAWICDKASDIADGYEVFEREGIIRASLEQKAEPVSGRKGFLEFCGQAGLDTEQGFDGYVNDVTAGAWLVWRNKVTTPPSTAEVEAGDIGRVIEALAVEAKALDTIIEAFDGMGNESDNHELNRAILEAKRIREQSND